MGGKSPGIWGRLFDCVYPSRNGRHGHVYTRQLNNARYDLDERIKEGW